MNSKNEVNKMSKVGLVLEGGAMRGMFTVGVLDIMMEEQIHYDGIMGVSAGALFGVNYLSGQKGRALRYNKKYNQNKDYMGMRSLFKTGNFVNTELAYRIVPRHLDKFDDEAFMASGVPFYAVVTEMKTGQPEYIQVESVFKQMDVLRASGSMPFVSQPVLLNGKYYLDGGVSDSIPYEKMLEMGYEKLVVVLTRDLSYRKSPMSKLPIQMYYKYPEFKKQMQKRHDNYNQSVEKLLQLEKEGRIFVIRPNEPLTIQRTERDPEKLQQVYDLGTAAAKEQLEALKSYLG